MKNLWTVHKRTNRHYHPGALALASLIVLLIVIPFRSAFANQYLPVQPASKAYSISASWGDISVTPPGLAVLGHPDQGNLAASDQEPTRTEIFRVDGPGKIQISNIIGDIAFRDTDSDEVRIEIYMKRSFSLWGESRRDEARLIVVQNKNDVNVQVEPPRSGRAVGSGSGARPPTGGVNEISFVVFAPPYMEVILKTGTGNINARGLGSNHDLRTGSGSIIMERSRGEGRLLTSGGNIVVDRFDGTLMCLSAGGNIRLNSVNGMVKAKTRGGNINADLINGSLVAETEGGSINASLITLGDGLLLQTRAGDIVAKLPHGLGMDVVMKGSRASISDWSSFQGIRRNNEVDGALHGGGVTVNLFTRVGNTEIILTRSTP